MSSISILMPTRKRTVLAEKSINGLISKAGDQSKLELLLAIDNDDTETIDWLNNGYLEEFRKNFTATITPVRFDRLGYHQMNQYLNELARLSTKDWLFFWNDDAEMQTDNWDAVIYKLNGFFGLLRAQVTNHPHPFALFPIVPRKWYELLGHLSATCQTDRFIFEVAYKITVQQFIVNIPVNIEHDRYDLTGNNNDEVYKERVYMEGNPANPLQADSPEAQAQMWKDSMKISKFLAQQRGVILP